MVPPGRAKKLVALRAAGHEERAFYRPGVGDLVPAGRGAHDATARPGEPQPAGHKPVDGVATAPGTAFGRRLAGVLPGRPASSLLLVLAQAVLDAGRRAHQVRGNAPCGCR